MSPSDLRLPADSGPATPWSLGISASPSTVCAYGVVLCPAGTNTTRLTLTAQTPAPPVGNWSSVQLLFVLDFGLFAGGGELGWPDANLSPDISGADHYFAANAGAIARSIAAAHPSVNMSFALEGTVGTPDQSGWDDGDSPADLIVVGSFVPADGFGAAVNTSGFPWYVFDDIDYSDNVLQSDSITAIYGGLVGYGINWSSQAHHVLVWVGATAPIDPEYPMRFCLKPAYGSYGCAQGPTCEAAHAFNNSTTLPACERWRDPNSSDPNASSLSNTALFGPACFGSAGGYCTIDAIILNATPTNPASPAWSTANATARADAVEDADSVVRSGCDLANATGGTWEGPWGFRCASLGLNGTLNYTGTTVNDTPGLDRALTSVGLGAGGFTLGRPAAIGGPLPMFQVVLPQDVRPAPVPNATTSCTRLNGSSATCPAAPMIETVGSDLLLGWNWSGAPSGNWMAWGDRWSASIDVSVVREPSNGTAVDLCAGPSCLAAGAGLPSGGLWSGMEASEWPGGPIERTSFPLVEVQVIAPYPLGGALTVRPPQGLESLRVTLTCVLSGGVPPFHFAWLFGDGTSGSTTVATTAHVYPQAGNYSAVVQVTDAAMATARATTIVRVYAPLEVNGTADPPAGPAPLVVTLEASLHGGLPPYNVSWESGTGQVNNTSVAVVEFDRAGSYVATFHVTDASGQSDSGEVDILVLAPRPVLLGANATLLQLEPNRTGCGDVPEDATLGASGSGGVEPYTFAWSFGDGGTGSGSITRHSYARPGNYTVLVEVQDSTGANTSTSLSIEIRGVTCPTSPPPAIGWLAPVVGIGLGGTVVVGVLAVLWRGHHPRTGPPDS